MEKQELQGMQVGQGTSAVQETRMNDLHELTDELMKDPEFKKEYDALQSERDLTMSLVMARKKAGLTQAELSEKTGISQSDISRLENGSRNPTIALLNRIASALNATCRIEFVPNVRRSA
ncbi:helix-turn-helix domain-containing protein [Gardnerella vaginalis]|uniref:helix-turn-helix domain-containing protein n=1 Tax=Gardnerella vaginalis TaxID=2702 RepID=UPI0035C67FA9